MPHRIQKGSAWVTSSIKRRYGSIAPGLALQRVRYAPTNRINPSDIRILQRTIGNRAVGALFQAKVDEQQILQRQKAPCPDCVKEEEELKKTPSDGIQRQMDEEEEEAIQPRLQRQVEEEDEEAIQAKLSVGEPGEIYEKEADRAADAVVNRIQKKETGATFPEEEIAKLPSAAISRKTANAAGTVQRVGEDVENGIDSLRGKGSPLSDDVRQKMEAGFGVNFSNVRVHTGDIPAKMNKNVNAKAFTVGKNIFFNKGEYRPHTRDGQRLLAHELTHTIQQSGAVKKHAADQQLCTKEESIQAFLVQRSCGTPADCSPDDEGYPLIYRSPGGGKTLRSCRAAVGYAQTWLNDFFASGMLQECINLHIRLAEEQGTPLPEEHRRSALISNGATKAPLEVDCWFGTNTKDVTEAFQAAVFEDPAEWDGKIGPKTWDAILRYEAAPTIFDCPFRRSDGSTPPTHPAPPVTPTLPPGTPICGPDMTTEVQNAVSNTRTTFAGWSDADREAHCDALDSLITGAYAWDIIELHNNAWIHMNYRPACATAGATPPCGSTVEIDNECSYAGSPNYVIYGAMCRLCHDHYVARGNSSGRNRFTHAQMQVWINRYKGTGWLGLGTPSANFIPSTQWATAGYNGWPGGGGSPGGDRNTCRPACTTPYTGPGFTVAWWRLRPRRRTVI